MLRVLAFFVAGLLTYSLARTQDGAALCDWYNGLTSGQNSLNNWCVGSGPYSPCGIAGISTWAGVTCKLDGAPGKVAYRVVRLDLTQLGLGGLLPSAVGYLDSLTKLDLYSNSLSGSLPSQLGLLTKLQYLGLDYNKFTGSLPSHLGLLSYSLVRLSLDHNRFTSCPASFCNLKTSIYLYLNDNPGMACLPTCLTNPPYTGMSKDYWLDVCMPAPTANPTFQPTSPSARPTPSPTKQPTPQPTGQPSRQPTRQPSSQPSRRPTRQPTRQPSSRPSIQPSSQPSSSPTNPTGQPSRRPTAQPSAQPTHRPTSQPSGRPSCLPTTQPTTTPTEVAPLHIVHLTLTVSGLSTSDLSELVLFAMRTALGTALGLPTKYITPPEVTAQSRRLRGQTVLALVDSTLYVDMSANFPASKWKTYTAPTSTRVIFTFENSFLAIAKMKIKVVSLDAPGLGFVLPSSSTTGGISSDSIGVIVGSVLGSLLFAVCSYGIFYRCTGSHSDRRRAPSRSRSKIYIDIDIKNLPEIPEIAWSTIDPPQDAGDGKLEGSCGIVFRGTWSNALVAVKIFKIGANKIMFTEAKKRLLMEAATFVKARQNLVNQHHNILVFYGIAVGVATDKWIAAVSRDAHQLCCDGEMIALVTKFEQGGSLDDLLHGKMKRHFSMLEKIRWLRDIAKALYHLHHCDGIAITHGDLKPLNILLSEAGEVRLADFGLSKIRDEVAAGIASRSYSKSPGGGEGGTWPYNAPELMIKNSKKERACPSRTTDMYSFGTMAWEVLTEKRPWAEKKDETDRNDSIKDDKETLVLTDLPLETPQAVVELISRCLQWSQDEICRPVVDDALKVLEEECKKLEQGVFDVFISYRVMKDSRDNLIGDSKLAEMLYNKLTAMKLRVWWDHKCIRPGEKWEDEFIKGLCNSRSLVPIISRKAIKEKFEALKQGDPQDNVLLEYRLALELRARGAIKNIYPLLVGDEDATSGHYGNYLNQDCAPKPASNASVSSVEAKLRSHLESQQLGPPVKSAPSVKNILDEIMAHQAGFVIGNKPLSDILDDKCMAIAAMVAATRTQAPTPSSATPVSVLSTT